MRPSRIILPLLALLALAACQSMAPEGGLRPVPGRSGDFLWQGGAYQLGGALPAPPEGPRRTAALRP